MKVAIIGAGISGLSAARFMNDKGYETTVFERESYNGGLIHCEKINGSLFHTCGGHVFNSKRNDILEWFWNIFDKTNDFIKADRNAVVQFDRFVIPYPIENHMYLFDESVQKDFIEDLLDIHSNQNLIPNNFEEFLKYRFGNTLYNLYFKNYNEKVWRKELKNVPLSWLEGKLPMPTVEEMIFNNFNHIKEKTFVHSTFWYEKNNGSQFIADRLADGLNIINNSNIEDYKYINKKWVINGVEFDKVIFCGNIKELVTQIKGIDLSGYYEDIEKLDFHGTTSVFCSIENNPYSWIYLPSYQYESHRIICTGNFSPSNNKDGINTCTVEFTDYISKDEIIENLKRMPLNPSYLSHKYNKYTYPIQDKDTRHLIQTLKRELSKYHFYFTGRFADWEYYNMDVAMGASMDLCNSL